MAKPIIALMYDFDKTLSPRNMQEYGFMDGLDMTAAEFWQECTAITKKHHMDSILAYMYLMLEKGKSGLVLRRETFNALGRTVKLFPGVESWFDRINAYCEERGAVCEHYISSSGLKEIIEGSKTAGAFKDIYAAEFLYGDDKLARWPAMAVNYTSKTQFLYRVNKGVFDVTDQKSLNEHTPEDKRRVPFGNMIYFGDGDTDVPCMKIVSMFGGNSVAVYNPADEKKKKGAQKLHRQGRVNFYTPAVYTRDSRTYQIVCAIIDKIKAESELKRLSR